MCGFFLSTKYSNKLNEEKLAKISKLLVHRGPDSEGFYQDHCILAKFFRLSIRDMTSNGDQPMHDISYRYLFLFNGEIYNTKELKKEIRFTKFKGSSDTEVLLYFLIEHGSSKLDLIEGMFSFILYDKKEKKIFFGRDRFGIKPLYYTKINDDFYFSSEIKPLLVIKNKNFLNNNAVLDFFFKSSMDHSEITFFKDICSVRPGFYGYIQNKKILFKNYWDLATIKRKQYLNFSHSKKKLKNILIDSVAKHLISDRKIALFLSGGTDSTALLNIILNQTQNIDSFETFTYGFKDAADIDETKKVQSYAKKINIKNYSVLLTPEEVVNQFQDLSIIMESPFTSIRIFAIKKLYKFAKNLNYKVIIEGDGGDEIFGGYDYNFLPYLFDLYKEKRNRELLILDKIKKFVKLKNRTSEYMLNLILTGTYQYGSTSDGTLSVNSDFFNFDFLDHNLSEKYFDDIKYKNLNNLQNSQIKDICSIKLPRSLKYKDRISMSEGIEARLPLLHHPFVEYGFYLPNHYKFKNFESRYIFKKIANNINNQNNSYSLTKNTIVDPQEKWMKNELKDFFIDNINSSYFKNLGYFNQKNILKEFHSFCKNKKSSSSFIFFQILSFVQFQKAFRNFNV
jgi:asparagine synthase (glutamine-hydrolysing)